MIIKIANKEVELNFGVRFVRELDKVKGVTQNGIQFGMALNATIPALTTYDPVALADVLYCASCTAKVRPSMEDVYNYIDNADDIKKVFDEVLSELKEANATKVIVKNLTKNIKA